MPVVFVDSGFLIAKLNDRDQLHETAVAATKGLGSFQIVTTQMVLTEVLNFMSDKGEHLRGLAVDMIQRLENNPDVEIIRQTDAQFKAAAERYSARGDQNWSLTDCSSFLVMEERHIREALAHDQDFEQAGFVALLR